MIFLECFADFAGDNVPATKLKNGGEVNSQSGKRNLKN
jgi:hypothetical protein